MLFKELKIGEKFFFLTNLLNPEGVQVCEKTNDNKYGRYENGRIVVFKKAKQHASVVKYKKEREITSKKKDILLFSDLMRGDQFFFLKDVVNPKGVQVCGKISFSQFDSYENGKVSFTGTATCEPVIKVRS